MMLKSMLRVITGTIPHHPTPRTKNISSILEALQEQSQRRRKVAIFYVMYEQKMEMFSVKARVNERLVTAEANQLQRVGAMMRASRVSKAAVATRRSWDLLH
jgi:hypothetical protein